MAEDSHSRKPPTWVLVALVCLIPAWPLGIYWLNNSYSGWSRLAEVYPVGACDMSGSQGPTSVTIVQDSGRRWSFNGRRGRKKYSEAGFNEAGFWVRARGTGWFSGPGTPVFVPWESVESCQLLRVRLSFPKVALIIADQPLLDACQRHLAGHGAR
ncbi:hypothetical protein [Thiorhodovibrio frisius]|uniref:Uncharacterized protein n=1 Tax=Thiorhodovibrio frisius TaxID=631362 RepID=H8YW07_9GAMM|nr:hypothetical protein [Thiorhodovibrio frisius]EIC23798.1 hypothetical protein Thi970DRAFT_00310 [Thiorhodovibrio frisius]WPL23193.1 hypothetical protein Thiofri_03376 [Thiorhodovibrio frisius]